MEAISLSQLNRRLGDAIALAPGLQNVWIVAETADVRLSGGHCYMELIEKDSATGRALAKARATIWAGTYQSLAANFLAETGQQFRSDIKVMVRASVNYHPLYGLSLNITGINPQFTLGDLAQRRMEMVRRLTEEGIINDNRNLPWPDVPWRIAVISARGAAGYGDFINQLYTNPARLRFHTRLFPAVMQGDRTAPSIIDALGQIAAADETFDCVVIIRGGGATSDLAAFEDYRLAQNIALYEIPVIIGIGHERDITLLDYVANMRVKTPTAAAEWLISRGEAALGKLQTLASAMLQTVSDRLSGCHRQLAYISGQLPAIAQAATVRARQRLLSATATLATIADSRLKPGMARLDAYGARLTQAVDFALARESRRLENDSKLLAALSPEATIRRGYSITRGFDGRAITSVAEVQPGQSITTVLSDGTVISKVITNS